MSKAKKAASRSEGKSGRGAAGKKPAPMTDRERKLAVLNYQPYDRLPIVHFGFWGETLTKWVQEGHLKEDLARAWGDGNPADAEISKLLGFDSNWSICYYPAHGMRPGFDWKVVKEFPDGSKHVLNGEGVVLLQKPGAGSIPSEIAHTFKDRATWEQHYRWRFQWVPERVTETQVMVNDHDEPWAKGGLGFLKAGKHDYMYGIHCGSLIGNLRNIVGVEQLSYLPVDDEALLDEMITVNADLCYQNVKTVLEAGAKFDFAHFWEDICYKNGPLVSPRVMRAKVGPHYKRLTDLLKQYGITIVSLDCDGCIDALVPIWFESGVNTMFPIEVGTWNATLTPWRRQHGRDLRGVGGMNKVMFARDRAAIDAEIERLRPQVELGGFIPCPDHRLAPDAKWDLVCYYCGRMRQVFG